MLYIHQGLHLREFSSKVTHYNYKGIDSTEMHYNDCPTFQWDVLSDAQIRRENNGIDDRFQLERIDDTTLSAWHFPTFSRYLVRTRYK